MQAVVDEIVLGNSDPEKVNNLVTTLKRFLIYHAFHLNDLLLCLSILGIGIWECSWMSFFKLAGAYWLVYLVLYFNLK